MREIKPLTPLFKQREAWLQFAKQAVEPQAFQFAISSPLKEQNLCLPLSFCLTLFLATPEMRDEPPLRQWQAWVGDGIARARNIDKKTKSVQSRATGNRKEKLKLKESMKHYFFFYCLDILVSLIATKSSGGPIHILLPNLSGDMSCWLGNHIIQAWYSKGGRKKNKKDRWMCGWLWMYTACNVVVTSL